jgi:hypothetical protein
MSPIARWLNLHGANSRAVWPKLMLIPSWRNSLAGSPTILVDGFDVTGRLREIENQASYRLDLSTQEQILGALRGLSVFGCGSQPTERLQASAFRMLLQTAKPIPVDRLAARMNAAVGITSGIEELRRPGHIQLDSDGCIVGAIGLSLRPRCTSCLSMPQDSGPGAHLT